MVGARKLSDLHRGQCPARGHGWPAGWPAWSRLTRLLSRQWLGPAAFAVEFAGSDVPQGFADVGHHLVVKLRRVVEGPSGALVRLGVDDLTSPVGRLEEQRYTPGVGAVVHDMHQAQVIGLDQDAGLLLGFAGNPDRGGLAVFQVPGGQPVKAIGPAGVLPLAE